jgi:glyoxylase-like metal-dependent hydrolase (beta-lactamase superfamily II)
MEQETTTQTLSNNVFAIAPGVWGRKDVFVNYYFIQDQTTQAWVLIDAGLKWSAARIKSMAEELFGDAKPTAIILTHGHFDHVGSLQELASGWDVPVYAHYLEIPYLTGKSSYPPADPTVGGGMMSAMSWAYPKGPVDIHEYIHTLPDDNSVPGMPEWKYLHTPGHAPGHVSFFRETDKVLIAGDAFVTTKQESAFHALTYTKHLSGPPKYFTCNWASAKLSVLKLAALDPEVVATGHGKPMRGEEMRSALHRLGRRFDDLAQPAHGRYVNEPAVTDETGVLFIPPQTQKIPTAIKVFTASLALLTITYLLYRSNKKNPDENVLTNVKQAVKKKFQAVPI